MSKLAEVKVSEIFKNVEHMFKSIEPYMQVIALKAEETSNRAQVFIEKNPDLIHRVEIFLRESKKLPDKQREAWFEAARLGWYVNELTPMSMRRAVIKGTEALDSYMIDKLEENWSALTSNIISEHPERAEILNCAFELHVEGRYLASIPLMLSQTDGICAKSLGAHFFTDHYSRIETITSMVESSDIFMGILLELLGYRTQFSAGIRKHSPAEKALAPNRNGILHGSHRHLDYGTKKNSLKTFSLLAFVTFVLSKKSFI